jgi:hypothetical protein
MQIRLNVKPVVLTLQNADRDYVNRKINDHIFNINIRNHGQFVFGYNIIKHNAKYQQTKYKSGDKKGQTKKSILVKKKAYKVYIYQFDSSLLNQFGLKIKQHSRHFTIG